MKSKRSSWTQEEKIENSLFDDLLRFYPTPALEAFQKAGEIPETSEYSCFKEYIHLRDRGIELEEIPLTDKQLLAIALVFYAGVSKRRAADAMNISTQTIHQHIAIALKKIEESL